jgi:hypothetical protein
MAYNRKVRQSSNEPIDATNDTPRLRCRLWRAVRRASIRALALGALVSVLRRTIARRRATDTATATPVERASGIAEWPPLVDTDTADIALADTAPWVDPLGGQCPLSHPVKGNASSKIYHVPGSRFYDMTTPERCYRDPAAAEADGMRAPKR